LITYQIVVTVAIINGRKSSIGILGHFEFQVNVAVLLSLTLIVGLQDDGLSGVVVLSTQVNLEALGLPQSKSVQFVLVFGYGHSHISEGELQLIAILVLLDQTCTTTFLLETNIKQIIFSLTINFVLHALALGIGA